MKKFKALSLVATLAIVGTACAADPTGDPTGDQTAPAGSPGSASTVPPIDVSQHDQGDPDDVFTLTIVTKNEDGTITTQQRPITRREEIADREFEKARLEALAKGIVLEPTRLIDVTAPVCPTASLQLWDAVNQVGNKLCLSGTSVPDGPEDLGTDYRTSGTCPNPWWGFTYLVGLPSGCSATGLPLNRVKSLKAGNLAGGFTPTSNWYQTQCSNDCLSWAANDSLMSINGGTCRYAQRGGRFTFCP
jgi:hypothetical protein